MSTCGVNVIVSKYYFEFSIFFISCISQLTIIFGAGGGGGECWQRLPNYVARILQNSVVSQSDTYSMRIHVWFACDSHLILQLAYQDTFASLTIRFGQGFVLNLPRYLSDMSGYPFWLISVVWRHHKCRHTMYTTEDPQIASKFESYHHANWWFVALSCFIC
jgi:hypothetical protein